MLLQEIEESVNRFWNDFSQLGENGGWGWGWKCFKSMVE
jgi:hypothetical protein